MYQQLMNNKNMKARNLFFPILILTVLAACQEKNPLDEKKAQLKEYKTELQVLRKNISKLEAEIAAEDPVFARENKKATLVTAMPVKKDVFRHFVEVSGSVESKKNILISAENMGTIQSIKFKEGDIVRQGQLLLSMDTELFQRSIEQLETQYELAKTMYERQKNLWEKNIGTEVQYLEAKNRKESLESQMANVKTQISKSQVRAPFYGTIEEVLVKEGEMAQVGSPLIRIVNHQGMFVKADLSESHIGKFKKNDPVTIYFPSNDKSIESHITALGQVINEQNRTFVVEAKLPDVDFTVKPNLLAILKLKDYEQKDASIIPTNLIQKDNTGDFVYIVTDSGSQSFATKIHIDRGITYRNETLVLSGLKGSENLINAGFRNVIDGGKVKIVDNVL
jgi:RND family efflux transporter MFP subunit